MAFEVEIKARVRDPAALAAVLEERCGCGRAFYKRDTYFAKSPVTPAPTPAAPAKLALEVIRRGAGGDFPPSNDPLFRLRTEGTDCRRVTAKKKNMQNGVEINEEIEFSIDDPRAFRAFCNMLGYEVSIEKTKNGHVWKPEAGLSIELAEIAGLGHFVEIEVLVENKSAIPAAKTRVRELLASLGFGEQDIEPRYYIDMLREI